jgi:hypothetical protein
VRVALFENAPNSENLAHHIVSCINDRLELPLADWVAVQLDRAVTNKAAISKIVSKFPDANPTLNFCSSHGISNAGKILMKHAPFANKFRSIYQKIIQFSGCKARLYAKEIFNEVVKLSGGVRFFQTYEQLEQLVDQGMKGKVIDDLLPYCLQNKCSEESAKAMFEAFGRAEKKADLGMAIIEAATSKDMDNALVKACYNAEGDSPLILVGESILKKMEAALCVNQPIPTVEASLEEASTLINECHAPYISKKTRIRDSVHLLNEELNRCKVKVADLLKDKGNLTSSGRSSRGRTRTVSQRSIDVPAIEAIDILISDAKSDLREKKDELKKRNDELRSAVEECDEFEAKFTHRTQDELRNYSRSLIRPVLDYYENLFNHESGDNYNTRRTVAAARLFDPFFLQDHSNDLVTLNALADDLKHFKYRQFSQDFILSLKRELPRLIIKANESFDWENVSSSHQFKTRLQKRMKRYDIQLDDSSWRSDPGEMATRIWQWWRSLQSTGAKEFPAFCYEVRLVVLSQLSSCSVERVFSRLQHVRNCCSDSLYEDMLEIRMLSQCNGDLSTLHR